MRSIFRAPTRRDEAIVVIDRVALTAGAALLLIGLASYATPLRTPPRIDFFSEAGLWRAAPV